MKNNRVLITGGTDGIGLATAKLLLKNDFKVVICGRNEYKLNNALSELHVYSNQDMIKGVVCDVRTLESISLLLEDVISFMGGVDTLINSAGVGVVAPLEDLSFEDWNSMIDINLTGGFNCCKHFVDELKKSKNANIINLGSRAGRYAFAGGVAYNATKAGLQGFSEALFLDLSKYNIGVTLVAPGTVATELSGVSKDECYLHPEDIAKVILDVLGSSLRTNINWVEIRPRIKK